MRSRNPPAACRLCGGPLLEQVLDFGQQPICNRFLQDPHEPEEVFPLVLGFCPVCAVPQMLEPAPVSAVRPRHVWITYREAEFHLDDMVDRALAACESRANAVVGGLTYKDSSTMARLQARGVRMAWQLDPREDLGWDADRAEMETVQELLTVERAKAVAARRGRCDIVVARHLLEHSHHPRETLCAVSALLKPGGLVVFEVPDFQRCMEGLDFASVWEEHILYFTRQTLASAVERAGFSVVESYEHPYTLENAVICLARYAAKGGTPVAAGGFRRQEAGRWTRYAGALGEMQRRVRSCLDALRSRYGDIVVFGAGHLSCKFINLYGVEDLIAFVVDDDSHKAGLFMAGSRLPILPSSEITRRGIGLCLLGLSPDSERKVRYVNRGFVEAGGTFMSMFPAHPDCFLAAST